MLRIALLVVLLPTYAFAQPAASSDPEQMHKSDCARARKLGQPCVIQMEAVDIEKDGVTPEGSVINSRDWIKFPSLVRIRQEFLAEILKSANDIE